MKTRAEKQNGHSEKNGELNGRIIRTFLVHNDPLMLARMSRLLEKDGRIAIVGSVSDGRKAFQPAAMSFSDLVLMDLHMPGFCGAEMARWLKQLRNPPVVFLVTSENNTESRAHCLAAGADALLSDTLNLSDQLQTAFRNFFPDQIAEKENQPAFRHE